MIQSKVLLWVPSLKIILTHSKYVWGVPKKFWAQLDHANKAAPGFCVLMNLPSKRGKNGQVCCHSLGFLEVQYWFGSYFLIKCNPDFDFLVSRKLFSSWIPCNLDLDSNIIQGCFQSKSCSKWLLNMVGTIMEVMVILSCHPQLHLEEEDPYNLENILGLCCYVDQDCRGPPAPNGVVGDKRGWPWPPWMFLPCLVVIWSNFCFEIP